MSGVLRPPAGVRSLVWTAAAVSLVLAGLLQPGKQGTASPASSVFIDPTFQTQLNGLSGRTFRVGASIDLVEGLGAYQWKIAFDPALIQVAGVSNNASLPGGELCVTPTIDNALGSVTFSCTQLASGTGAVGTVDLSSVMFSSHSMHTGTTALRFVPTCGAAPGDPECDPVLGTSIASALGVVLGDQSGELTLVDGSVEVGQHDVGIAGGGFRVAGSKIDESSCDLGDDGIDNDSCTKDVTIKIKNFGNLPETSVPYAVTLAIGPPFGEVVYSAACAGDAAAASGGVLSPNEVVTIRGCTVRYSQPLPGDYSHRLTVTHDAAHGGAATDVNPDNNSRVKSASLVP